MVVHLTMGAVIPHGQHHQKQGRGSVVGLKELDSLLLEELIVDMPGFRIGVPQIFRIMEFIHAVVFIG